MLQNLSYGYFGQKKTAPIPAEAPVPAAVPTPPRAGTRGGGIGERSFRSCGAFLLACCGRNCIA